MKRLVSLATLLPLGSVLTLGAAEAPAGESPADHLPPHITQVTWCGERADWSHGGGKSLPDTIFYYRGDELFAVRKAAFKAHLQTAPGYGSPGTPLLFNLANDPSERFEIGKEHPEIVAAIQHEVEKHRANLVPGPPQY